MTKHAMSGGSTGTENGTRLRLTIDKWQALGTIQRTSAAFQYLYSQRNVFDEPVQLDYQIRSDFADTPAGWWGWAKAAHGSTRNTSSGGRYGILGLPDAIYTAFKSTLAGATTRWTADGNNARVIYELINASGSFPWGREQGVELLTIWAGQGQGSSLGVGTS